MKLCEDEGKKKHYCERNKLCHLCCLPDHKVAGCPSWKAWQKKKEARKSNGNKSKPQQRRNQKAIRCNENFRYQNESKLRHNSHFLPEIKWFYNQNLKKKNS